MLQDEEPIVVDYQFFPHSEIPLHRQQESRPFLFTPVEERLEYGKVIHIGRKIDRTKDPYRGTHNVSLDPANMTSNQEELSIEKCIAFRSKVVSRHHAEMWVGKDGQVNIINSCTLGTLDLHLGVS